MLSIYVKGNSIIHSVRQYLERTVEKSGVYREVKKGIPMGLSLLPLLGAFYLSELDRKLEAYITNWVRWANGGLYENIKECAAQWLYPEFFNIAGFDAGVKGRSF
jgi:hypothetical protein